MSPTILLSVLAVFAAAAYYAGRERAFAVSDGRPQELHSLPSYHGFYVALWCALPTLVLVALWWVIQPLLAERALIAHLPADVLEGRDGSMFSLTVAEVKRAAEHGEGMGELDAGLQAAADAYRAFQARGAALLALVACTLAACGLWFGRSRVTVPLRARTAVERVLRGVMLVASMLAILATIGIVLSLLFETIRFFEKVPFFDFLFGIRWSPQTALRADQVGSSGEFGAIPLFAGTLLITLIAMIVAVPIGLLSAIYMSEYAAPRVRTFAKPLVEILAGVPTVVYGFFAALTVAPFVRGMGEGIGLDVASESALAAGAVMGIMIIPFVSSLSDDVMNAVPQTLRDGAYALGATQSETIRQVVLPAALPGIVGAVLLAISRAIGETMIVVMAAGLSANLTANPLEAVTTVTVQIVTLLVGDQEFDSAKTLAAFALGLVLFVLTLGLNVVALRVVRKYREKYD